MVRPEVSVAQPPADKDHIEVHEDPSRNVR